LQSAVKSLNQTAVSAAQIASRVDSSSSTGEIRQIVDDMSHAAAELRRTSGQIRIMSEQLSKTQHRLDSFLTNGDSVLVKLNSGQGSLGLLLNDPSLYRNGDSLLTQLRGLVSEVRTNPKKFVSVRIF
jgi:phospholipid/cholesterol/gamma-HCH transport system substrate-binding protein